MRFGEITNYVNMSSGYFWVAYAICGLIAYLLYRWLSGECDYYFTYYRAWWGVLPITITWGYFLIDSSYSLSFVLTVIISAIAILLTLNIVLAGKIKGIQYTAIQSAVGLLAPLAIALYISFFIIIPAALYGSLFASFFRRS